MLLSAVPQSHLEEDPIAQGVSQMQVDFLGLTAPGCGHVAPVESVSCSIISRTGCLDPLGAPIPVLSWFGAERPPPWSRALRQGEHRKEEVANAWPKLAALIWVRIVPEFLPLE